MALYLTTRLKDFPSKNTPVGDDEIYTANSEDSGNEVKVKFSNYMKNVTQLIINDYLASFSSTYTNGTVTQSGNIVTGVGTVFTSTGIKSGHLLVTADGNYAMVNNVISDTQLQVDTSNVISPGVNYTLYYNGIQGDHLGRVSFGNTNLAPIIPPVDKDIDFTVDNNECFYRVDTTAGDVAVELNAANLLCGKYFIFKKPAFVNEIVITPNGSDTIDGLSDYTVSASGGCVHIVSDGIDNWEVVAVV